MMAAQEYLVFLGHPVFVFDNLSKLKMQAAQIVKGKLPHFEHNQCTLDPLSQSCASSPRKEKRKKNFFIFYLVLIVFAFVFVFVLVFVFLFLFVYLDLITIACRRM